VTIPYIDPTIKHVQTTALRKMTADVLRGIKSLIVIHDSGWEPLVVMIPFEQYLKMQGDKEK
jgi:hypothetical protein